MTGKVEEYLESGKWLESPGGGYIVGAPGRVDFDSEAAMNRLRIYRHTIEAAFREMTSKECPCDGMHTRDYHDGVMVTLGRLEAIMTLALCPEGDS